MNTAATAPTPTPTNIAQTDYGPVALFLALITNQHFLTPEESSNEAPEQAISRVTSIPLSQVQKYMARYANAVSSPAVNVSLTTDAEVFNYVSERFQELAKDIMGKDASNNPFYPQGGCPRVLDKIAAIASLGKKDIPV